VPAGDTFEDAWKAAIEVSHIMLQVLLADIYVKNGKIFCENFWNHLQILGFLKNDRKFQNIKIFMKCKKSLFTQVTKCFLK